MAGALFGSLGLVLVCLFILWLVATAIRDVSIIDAFWGTGFVIVAWYVYVVQPGESHPRDVMLLALVSAWGLRLSLYLLWRNWGTGEDRRYVAMREHHGASFWWVSLVSVFLLQGILLWFVSLPVQAAMLSESTAPIGWLDGAGLALWICGFAFESIGDWQLARFKADPQNANAVMDRGLWRYTRHPNYFGDFCVWWGLYLIAGSGGAAWTILSPALMSFLLLRVSGVTLLERTIVHRRPEYEDYRRRTSAFFPWLPLR